LIKISLPRPFTLFGPCVAHYNGFLTFAVLFSKMAMNPLDEFTVPFGGLSQGVHRYEFEAGPSFFKAIASPLYETGDVQVVVTLDKQSAMLVLGFEAVGTLKVSCDRCTADATIPLTGKANRFLVVKFGDPDADPGTEEIMVLPHSESHLNLAQPTFEFIHSLVPNVIIPCEITGSAEVCNQEILLQLDRHRAHHADPASGSSIWKGLEGLSSESQQTEE
jgi:hypothetical protein